ncbi:MAG: UDP-2,3-diacylglucosamine diphosphatase LpxI [Candidatus Paracaedibacteraceae bacterium]|nr:UDP-2,3-diacylglucosamine diphosphatase LpxI [Candidatus Paracaedibacteraceae bacterium]
MINSPLAIIAGQGNLPLKIIAEQKKHRPIVILAIEGQTPTSIVDTTNNEFPILWTKFGLVAAALSFFKQHNVKDIVMAGGMTRPKMRDLSVDWVGTRWVSALGINAFKGDDHLLKALIGLFEKEGYNVVPAHNLVSNLFADEGVLTKTTPTKADLADLFHGKSILDLLSPYDVGQAIVVHDGCVLGIETIGGTEALLSHVKDLGRTQGGVFIKMPKRGQSQQADVPTIGIQTIRQVHNAGLSGIAIESAGVQILDLEQVMQLADELNLFIIGF